MKERPIESKLSIQEIYEKKIKTGYSELGAEDKENPDIWGNALWEGKNINIYTSPEFMKKFFTEPIVTKHPDKEEDGVVADFGGAEGVVLGTISEQLKEDGYRKITPVDLDINLESLKKKNQNLIGVNASLSNMPIRGNSVDAGVLRFVLPYNTKEKQEQILKNIAGSIKPGGVLIIFQDGGYSKDKGEKYNQFFTEASAAQAGKNIEEIKTTRYFASGEEITEMAERAGFKAIESRELLEVKSWLSPQAYSSRFNMDESQQANTKKVFDDWEKNEKINFENGRLERSLIYLVLEKPNRSI